MKKIVELFNDLEPNKKRLVVICGVAVIVVIFLAMGYSSRSNNKPAPLKQAPPKQKSIDLTSKDEDLALRLSLNNQLKELEDSKKMERETYLRELEALRADLNSLKTGQKDNRTYGDLQLEGVPPSPYQNGQEYSQDLNPLENVKLPPLVILGGISSVSVPKGNILKDNSTRKRLVNYIPAGSIMKATLLNGMYAPTMGKGKESPYPALFRTWDLAYLPNEVRKNLSGCFILGEAYGELSDSRVHIRLLKLSCISNDNKLVLERSIKGFVNGDDGKVGLFGTIRANFGKLALSALLAEFLGSAGDAIKSATQIETLNPLGGITTTTKPKVGDIALSATGSGVGEAARMLSKFYLDIMKEMSPVIEVYGRRDVELIIEQGIELSMDDFDWQGVLEDENDNLSYLIN